MVGQLPLLGEVDALLKSEEAKVENLSNLELQLKGLRIEHMTTQLVIYILLYLHILVDLLMTRCWFGIFSEISPLRMGKISYLTSMFFRWVEITNQKNKNCLIDL